MRPQQPTGPLRNKLKKGAQEKGETIGTVSLTQNSTAAYILEMRPGDVGEQPGATCASACGPAHDANADWPSCFATPLVRGVSGRTWCATPGTCGVNTRSGSWRTATNSGSTLCKVRGSIRGRPGPVRRAPMARPACRIYLRRVACCVA